jgi:CRISPR-associated protein Csb1
MSEIDLSPLNKVSRLLLTIPLKPLQGERFQPTGFPSLGAATYQTKEGSKLLVESNQSMANRLEATCWDAVSNTPIDQLKAISHITVIRGKDKKFLTDSMLEAHRINSPYLLGGSDKTFFNKIKEELGGLAEGPIDRRKLADVLLKYDIGSLIHGVFLAKKDLAGGRLRIARALSAFIEASGATVAASGGVKNDHVNPSGDTKAGFGNVPFSRDEFVADKIELFVNLDLALIRGYGLGEKIERLLILLSLFKVRKLIDGDLRLRTACDFEPISRDIKATKPEGFSVPSLDALTAALAVLMTDDVKKFMVQTTVAFEDELKKGKDKPDAGNAEEEADEPDDE